jgi:hypothetical protein
MRFYFPVSDLCGFGPQARGWSVSVLVVGGAVVLWCVVLFVFVVLFAMLRFPL